MREDSMTEKDKEQDRPAPPQPIRTEPETRRKDLEEGDRPRIKVEHEPKKKSGD
jgi:hypothetical protein